MNIGIGCDECEGRGYEYIGQDNGVDNTIIYPCPECTPPDVPEPDLDSDDDWGMSLYYEEEIVCD